MDAWDPLADPADVDTPGKADPTKVSASDGLGLIGSGFWIPMPSCGFFRLGVKRSELGRCHGNYRTDYRARGARHCSSASRVVGCGCPIAVVLEISNIGTGHRAFEITFFAHVRPEKFPPCCLVALLPQSPALSGVYAALS